jgi:hypothetical protein
MQWMPERNAIGHTPARFKRAGVGTNGILECKFMSENAQRTKQCASVEFCSVFPQTPWIDDLHAPCAQ